MPGNWTLGLHLAYQPFALSRSRDHNPLPFSSCSGCLMEVAWVTRARRQPVYHSEASFMHALEHGPAATGLPPQLNYQGFTHYYAGAQGAVWLRCRYGWIKVCAGSIARHLLGALLTNRRWKDSGRVFAGCAGRPAVAEPESQVPCVRVWPAVPRVTSGGGWGWS